MRLKFSTPIVIRPPFQGPTTRFYCGTVLSCMAPSSQQSPRPTLAGSGSLPVCLHYLVFGYPYWNILIYDYMYVYIYICISLSLSLILFLFFYHYYCYHYYYSYRLSKYYCSLVLLLPLYNTLSLSLFPFLHRHLRLFPVTLCGVLVFRSVPPASSPASASSASSSLSHTIFHTPSFHIQFCNTPAFTHIFVTHHLSHTIFATHYLSHPIFHTHTHLCHTHHLSHTIFSHTIFHTIFHTPSFANIFVTHNFVTHHLCHTIGTSRAGSGGVLGSAWSPRTPRHFGVAGMALVLRGRHGTWRHRPSFCVADVAPGDIDLRFAWQAWHLWHLAGSCGALGSAWSPRTPRHFCVAGVALGDIDLRFAWQAWLLWDCAGSDRVSLITLSHTTLAIQLCHTPSFTHNFVTHHLVTQTFATQNFVTHYPHNIVWGSCFRSVPPVFRLSRPSAASFSHTIFRTPSFTHLLSHTLFHTLSFTHHLSHTIFVTHHLSQTSFDTPSLSHTIFHRPSLTHHLSHTPSLSHSFVTHHLSHTSLSHTIFHTRLCHTLCHTPSFTHHLSHLFVTHHLCHTFFDAPSLSHSLSHTIFVTLSFTHTHTPSFTPLCHSPSLSHLRFAWQTWHLWDWAGVLWRAWVRLVARDAAALWRGRRGTCVAGVDNDLRFAWHTSDTGLGLVARLGPLGRPGGAAALLRGKRGAWRHRPSFCVASVALGDNDLRVAWQAWHL